MEERVIGVVEKIIYKNNDNKYYILNVLQKDKQCIVTINHLKIVEGCSYDFYGKWVNSKYGNQFQASKVIEIPPSTEDAMIKYLSSSFFKGVGPVLSSKIVKHFGDKTYDILKNNIDRLSEVKGLSKKKLEAIKTSWAANIEINDIMLFLQSHEISTLLASKIYEFYKSDCISKIKENPYNLERDIENVGFKSCDKIALSMGFQRDCKERISAGIRHTLNEGENNEGHCFLYHKQILDKATELLGVAIKEKIDEILFELIDNNEIKLSKINEEERFYSNKIYYDERFVANKVDILKNTPGLIHNGRIIEEWEENLGEDGIELSDEQKNAVLGIVNEKISVLTGGAGVGKTTVLKYLFKLLDKLKVDFLIAAPTGRAAKRISETSGYDASTIHRLLEWDFVKKTFNYNSKNTLNIQFLVLDECSMIGISLFDSVLKALPQDAHILLVGDPNQIPPVSCGKPFHDLIQSNLIKTFKLTRIFRQTEGSDIIKFSYDVINGIEPQIESPLVEPEMWTNGSSCMFIDSDFASPDKVWSDYPDYSTLYYKIDIVEMIRKLYCEIIGKYYPDKEVQIIIPQNVSDLGTIKINKMIQSYANPASPDKPEIIIGDTIYRKFDKILIIKNDYDYDLFNGEMGKIIEINSSERSCIVEFGAESKIVEIKRDGLLLMKLGYACSVHKAQGSEFDIIIFPIAMNFSRMLYRQLLYTGMTRGKLLSICIGSRRAMSIAIKNIDPIIRQTSLIELLQMKTDSKIIY